MKDIDLIIGERLKKMRNDKGYSLRYVAKRVGLSNVTISHYETGRNGTDLATLKKLCNLYGVNMLEFLSEIYNKI